jgi:hypothetical protein
MLHNNQSPATVALVVPNREALLLWMAHHGHAPDTLEGQDAALRHLEEKIDAFRAGGKLAGTFPERWLPSTFAVLEEPFTEQNRFLNSTLKMVRGRIEEHFADRIAGPRVRISSTPRTGRRSRGCGRTDSRSRRASIPRTAVLTRTRKSHLQRCEFRTHGHSLII